MGPYGTEFYLNHNGKRYFIKVYFLDYVEDLPTSFHVFIDHEEHGFIKFNGEKWEPRNHIEFTKGWLTDHLAQAIGDYLILWFE